MDKPTEREIKRRPTAKPPANSGMNPRIVELFELVFADFLGAYEACVQERPSIERTEQIKVATSRVLGRSAFSMKSVLDGYEGLNLERARTLVALHQIGGKGTLGEVRDTMGLTRQAAYSRLQALLAGSYAEKRSTVYGTYFITAKGVEAAQQIASLE